MLLGSFVCCIWLLLSTEIAPAQDVEAPEPKVKAAFLYNFTKLVYWPTNTFANSKTPLVIGVLGRDPFGKELDTVVAGRTVEGRNIQVARFNKVEEITNCQVLFIDVSERRNLDSILDALRDKPILTVSDIKGFASRGMIELTKSNDTMIFRINLEAADHAGLRLSSRLTRLDKTLQPPGSNSTNSPPAIRN